VYRAKNFTAFVSSPMQLPASGFPTAQFFDLRTECIVEKAFCIGRSLGLAGSARV